MIGLLKNNLVSIMSIALTVALLALGAFTMSSKAVTRKMGEIASGAGQIQSLMNAPANPTVIEAEKKRVEETRQQIEQGVAAIREINGRKPLMSGVFPAPQNETRRFEFKAAYAAALDQLARKVEGSDLPGSADIQEAEDEIAELRDREREVSEEGGEASPAIGAGTTSAPAAPTTPRGPSGAPGARGDAAKESTDPKYNPKLRAHVIKAQTIRCYVGSDNRRSYHVSPIVRMNTAPDPDAMWFAQVGLWLHEDVFAALGRANAAAARQLPKGEAPSVQNLPVKRIERLDILGYVLGDKLISFPRDSGTESGSGGGGSLGGATVGGSSAKSLTGRVSDNDFDVVRLELTLVVDQRDLLQVLDEITRSNLYQCVDCDYELVAAKDRDDGYFYGPDPVIRVRLVFEAYFARPLYDPLMPEVVRKLFSGGTQ